VFYVQETRHPSVEFFLEPVLSLTDNRNLTHYICPSCSATLSGSSACRMAVRVLGELGFVISVGESADRGVPSCWSVKGNEVGRTWRDVRLVVC
jgi:hypothetical protein